MSTFAAGIYGIVLVIFFAISAAVVYHLRRFGVPGDHTAFLRRVFIVGSFIFLVSSLILFFNVPWGEIRLRPLV